MELGEYVHDDLLYKIPAGDRELLIAPSIDVIHRFEAIGASILKYFDSPAGKMCYIPLDEAAVAYLHDECDVHIVERSEITVSEHEAVVSYKVDHFDFS